MIKSLLNDRLLIFILLFLLLYGGWFIYKSSGVVDGKRYFCLFDDQMISMTYARNFVNGYGLDWSRRGDPVEGFSNPLWTFLFIPLHFFVKDLSVTSLYVQLLCLLLLIANLLIVYRLTKRFFTDSAAHTVYPAVILTATNYFLNYWSLTGFETALQVCLMNVSLYLLFSEMSEERDHSISLSILLLASTLLRMDMFIFAFIVLALSISRKIRLSINLTRAIYGLGIFLAGNAAYLVFRLLYFGDLLPNTYYLKLYNVDPIVRMQKGLWLLLKNFLFPSAIIVLAIIVFAVANRWYRKRHQILITTIAVYAAYSVWVGGDLLDAKLGGQNRWLAIVMPLVAILINSIINKIRSLHLFSRESPDFNWRFVVTMLITVYCLLVFNGVVDFTKNSAMSAAERWFLLRPPLHSKENMELIRDLKKLQTVVPDRASIAVVWAGIPAYFSDFRMIDLLGYNDKVISRKKARVDENTWKQYLPGHSKTDYGYSLGTLKPDVIFQMIGQETAENQSILHRHQYVPFDDYYVRDISSQRSDASAGFVQERTHRIRCDFVREGIISAVHLRVMNGNGRVVSAWDTFEKSGNLRPELYIDDAMISYSPASFSIQIDGPTTLEVRVPGNKKTKKRYTYELVFYFQNEGFLFLPVGKPV